MGILLRMGEMGTYTALAAGALGLVVGLWVCQLVERGARDALRGASIRRKVLSAAVCGLAFGGLVATYGLTHQALELCAFAAILLGLSLVDLDRREIPNALVLAAFALRLACLVLTCVALGAPPAVLAYYLMSAIGVGLALLVTVLVADWLLGGESMGGGDLKLFAVAALYVGWEQSLVLVGLACVLGIAGSLLSRVRWPGAVHESGTAPGPSAPSNTFPFGPSISVACILVMLLGGHILG